MRSARAVVLAGLDQRQRVLGEAGAAIARTGVQEFAADALVEADAARDLLHVGADLLAQIGDLVDEGDLGREKGVGRIFGEFGRAAPDEDERRRVERQRPVDFLHHLARARVLDADDDAVGALEILDRRAFAQEFRIGDDGEIGVRIDLADDALDLVAGADRHGGFVDDDREAVERAGDRLGGGVDDRKDRRGRRRAATACRPR